MDETPNLRLPYILAAQAQKHVTHNEAIRALDAIVQLSVLDRSLAAPPPAPADGSRYIVAASATGDWSGHDHDIAAYQDGAWMFYPPREGFIAWVADEDVVVVWTGAAWTPLSTGGGGGGGIASLNPADGGLVGVNATADTTNRLAIASPASLFNHEGAGHQLKINKAAAAQTASLLFQDAFSGRAELGLTGDDNWHVKVSADGAAWKEALLADRSTGFVTLPFSGAGFMASCVPGTDDFSIAASPTMTPCKWSGVAFDSHAGYVPATGVYTIPVAGKWAVFGVVDASGDASANYAALACVPGGATGISVIHGFARAGVKSVVATPVLFSVGQFAAGQTIKFFRYFFGGTVTLINVAGLPSSLIGAVRLSS